MIKKVTFYNDITKQWNFDCFVKIVTDICNITDIYIGNIEYNDNTFLDIYTSCGQLIGKYIALEEV